MQQYVLCFLYDAKRNTIALVKKNKPAWQAGRFNAPGGKIEPEEKPLTACSREFLEETGVDIPEAEWRHFLTLSGSMYRIYAYVCMSDEVFQCHTTESEEIHLLNVDEIDYSECLDNLKWIIPLSRCKDKMVVQAYELGE